jgi:hypothetical protein
MRAPGPGLSLLFTCFALSFPVSAAEEISPPFANPELERYFQWGLYDSLAQGVESRLRDSAHAEDADLALLSAYRGVALFSQGHRDAAREWFRLAACRDSAMKLDAYYLTAGMLEAYREAASVTGSCIPRDVPAAEGPEPPQEEMAPAGAEPPTVAASSFSRRTWILRGAFAASALLAAGSGWEFYRESRTFAGMERAARSGEIEYYERNRPRWEKELKEHRRNTWIAAGGAAVFAGVGTALIVSGRKASVSVQPGLAPRAALAWSF